MKGVRTVVPFNSGDAIAVGTQWQMVKFAEQPYVPVGLRVAESIAPYFDIELTIGYRLQFPPGPSGSCFLWAELFTDNKNIEPLAIRLNCVEIGMPVTLRVVNARGPQAMAFGAGLIVDVGGSVLDEAAAATEKPPAPTPLSGAAVVLARPKPTVVSRCEWCGAKADELHLRGCAVRRPSRV